MEAPKKVLWYMQLEGTEFGPFSQLEVESLIAKRKLKGTIYVWRAGMTNWVPASACTDFAHLALYLGGQTTVRRLPKSHKGKEKQVSFLDGEKRSDGRRALIATVSVMTSARTAFLIGVCEDISLTGIQVILDSTNEIEIESPLTLKVDPLGLTKVSAFQIVGKVVWVKGEEMRMGVSFGDLTAVARQSLAAYLKGARDRELAADQNLIEVR